MSKGRFADDITGQRFGSLVVVGRAPNQEVVCNGKLQKRAMWYCKCDCGSPIKAVRGAHLKSGRIVSCGCVRYKNSRDAKIKHNSSKSRLYYVWCDMKRRCDTENIRSFKYYGGRGITVCDEWKNDFSAFKKWSLENGYDENAEYGKCTLDRIDVNASYSPSNCRWVSLKEQSNNRRDNRHISYGDAKYTISELSDLLHINYDTLKGRICRGWRSQDYGLPPSPISYRKRSDKS